jgi:hypothetical protein
MQYELRHSGKQEEHSNAPPLGVRGFYIVPSVWLLLLIVVKGSLLVGVSRMIRIFSVRVGIFLY